MACLIAGIISYMMGMAVGSYVTIKSVAEVASGFIDVDETLINEAINIHKWRLKTCFPSKLEDAFNNRNQGK